MSNLLRLVAAASVCSIGLFCYFYFMEKKKTAVEKFQEALYEQSIIHYNDMKQFLEDNDIDCYENDHELTLFFTLADQPVNIRFANGIMRSRGLLKDNILVNEWKNLDDICHTILNGR